MTLRENCRYGAAAPTSMGVRLTPPGGAPVHTSSLFTMQATSAETNVLNVPASLGFGALALTNFVEGSPISLFIKSELRRRNIGYVGPDVPQGGPWGCRHQFNIADSGFGARGPRVHNDRAGEVGRMLNAEDYDFEEIFGAQGVQILHLSGLVAALSPGSGQFCLAAARAAKKYGTRVSFDLNYRASFWQGRQAELRAVFGEIAALADILVGNEEDFQLSLGFAGPKAGGGGLAAQIDSFQEMIGRAQAAYPGAGVFGTTLRQVVSAGEHLWGAITACAGAWTVIEPRPIRVLDRIGGGDAFVGGLLYGILKGYAPARCTQLGWAAGALAVTVLEDYASPADEAVLRSIYEGNARVMR